MLNFLLPNTAQDPKPNLSQSFTFFHNKFFISIIQILSTTQQIKLLATKKATKHKPKQIVEKQNDSNMDINTIFEMKCTPPVALSSCECSLFVWIPSMIFHFQLKVLVLSNNRTTRLTSLNLLNRQPFDVLQLLVRRSLVLSVYLRLDHLSFVGQSSCQSEQRNSSTELNECSQPLTIRRSSIHREIIAHSLPFLLVFLF